MRWLVWGIAGATIALGSLTSLFVAIAPLHDAPDLFGAAPLIVMACMGAVVASKRPRHPIGWLLSGVAFLLVAQAFAQRYARYAYVGHHQLVATKLGAWLGVWSWMPAFAMLTLVFMLFPTGRPLSRRWRWIVALPVALIAAIPIAAIPTLSDTGKTLLEAPSPSELPGGHALAVLSQGVMQALLAVGLVALFIRWFRSRGTERQQMKWFVFGASVLALAIVVVFVSGAVLHTDDPTSTPVAAASLLLGFTAVSVATAVAVLRYRLYDIDRIISRTVSYALVTAVLAGTFALVVLLPTTLVGSQAKTPQWLVAVATLAVAALFRPVRKRVQTAVDRRFNRARYDAARTIEAFSARLRDEVDIDALGTELREVVGRTMQPEHVSLWTRERPRR